MIDGRRAVVDSVVKSVLVGPVTRAHSTAAGGTGAEHKLILVMNEPGTN